MKLGKLYVIGTPIGNLEDITLRALRVIGEVEVLVCEDTRVTAKLVNHYIESGQLQQAPKYFALNEFNESSKYKEVLEILVGGQTVGLVSDAGMPTISDPGFRVIRAAIEGGVEVEVIPGPSSLGTALCWSGLGGEVSLFGGFLPKKDGKAKKILQQAAKLLAKIPSAKIVLFASPYRIKKDLHLIREVCGEVQVVLLRELTKKFQERIEAPVSELSKQLAAKELKGEVVLVFSALEQ